MPSEWSGNTNTDVARERRQSPREQPAHVAGALGRPANQLRRRTASNPARRPQFGPASPKAGRLGSICEAAAVCAWPFGGEAVRFRSLRLKSMPFCSKSAKGCIQLVSAGEVPAQRIQPISRPRTRPVGHRRPARRRSHSTSRPGLVPSGVRRHYSAATANCASRSNTTSPPRMVRSQRTSFSTSSAVQVKMSWLNTAISANCPGTRRPTCSSANWV